MEPLKPTVPDGTGHRPLAHSSQLFDAHQWAEVARRLHMSERELQVVQGVFDDLKEAAIAARLGISTHTVHTHLERLYRKLGVNGRCSMIVAIMTDYLQSGRHDGMRAG